MIRFAKNTRSGHTLMDAVVALSIVGILLAIIMSAQSYYMAALRRSTLITSCEQLILNLLDGYRTLTEVRLTGLRPGVLYQNRHCQIELLSTPTPEQPFLTIKLSNPQQTRSDLVITLDYRLAR